MTTEPLWKPKKDLIASEEDKAHEAKVLENTGRQDSCRQMKQVV